MGMQSQRKQCKTKVWAWYKVIQVLRKSMGMCAPIMYGQEYSLNCLWKYHGCLCPGDAWRRIFTEPPMKAWVSLHLRCTPSKFSGNVQRRLRSVGENDVRVFAHEMGRTSVDTVTVNASMPGCRLLINLSRYQCHWFYHLVRILASVVCFGTGHIWLKMVCCYMLFIQLHLLI